MNAAISKKASWVKGLAEWHDGETVCLSVAFTWKIHEAFDRAQAYRAEGRRVRVGGPGLFLPQIKLRLEWIKGVEVGGDYPEAVTKHNPDATFASRGCDQDCSFCIVPPLEGSFTFLPNFVPRPILCDNNLSGLPADYQQHIIRRYQDAGVKLRDANSGFEPKSFTRDVYERWRPLVNAGGGAWRFGYDEMSGKRGPEERREVLRVMDMLTAEPQKRKRVYVLIGNEPFAECMQRIQEVLDHGCEPHVQPIMKLNALERKPWVRFDWTEDRLRQVARWANSWAWKKCTFAEFDPKRNKYRPHYDENQGLFL